MVFWNSGFVRGLAETVLTRAKAVRSGLLAQEESAKPKARKVAAATGAKKPARRRKPAARRRSPRHG